MADFATVEDIEKAWRPLLSAEKPRAEYYLGFAQRRLRSRWKDIEARVSSKMLDEEDVRDVVVHMVLGVLDGAPARGAKSWSQTSGPFSQSVTLESGRTDLIVIEDWMVQIFEQLSAALPVGSFPPSGRYEGLFEPRGSR